MKTKYFEINTSEINWSNLITVVAIPLAVGGLSAWLTKDGMKSFASVNQPPLTPPMWLFPIVWTILFILMGIASYLIYSADADTSMALTLYAIQLVLNFFWSIWFFNCRWYLFSLIWLLCLWGFIIATMVSFFRISKPAGYMLLPYFIWVTFAAYLNLGVYLLN